MPPRSSSPLPPSQEDLEFVQAARRFNATGAIWPSTVLPPRSRALAKEGDQENWLFEIHERSCRALGWHLSGAMRRHSNPLKVVTSFVAGVGFRLVSPGKPPATCPGRVPRARE